ncbi:SpaA isopeptide-forming pilin-related protein [Bifidobacterium porcinum]|uniref:SpaA isopeptide-forming pilin-related protein n=1 Tax=Bifidobacterium porcinum TaxID=212365 RepID=UPI00399465D4
MTTTTMTRRLAAGAVAAATLAGGLMTLPAHAASSVYDITINAAADEVGGVNTLKGRRFTAYKLADYVDGTFVNTGNKDLDGVAVDTPDALKPDLDRVLAKTTGVSDVSKLPGWTDAGADPVAWMGGFRQTLNSSNQADGQFGFGWNESGPQKNGNNSPTKAYTGTVREFADNIVKDANALAKVKNQEHSNEVTCQAAASCTIPLKSSGLYLILDSAPEDKGTYTDKHGFTNTWNIGVTQPMIVPTKADSKDLATQSPYATTDGSSLGTVGKLGVITVKNVADQDVLPATPPKRRDETVNPGKDAADNGSDIGDTIPYIVNYRIPDMSAYKAAYDNHDQWIYNYRIIDKTDPGLRINSVGDVTVTIPGIDGKTIAVKPQPVSALPSYAADGAGTPEGQPGEPDAWVYLSTDANDASHLEIGLGRWIVKNYGDIARNDKTQTMYGREFTVRYTATVTPKVLQNKNMTKNDNHLEYSANPDNVNSGKVVPTPEVKIRQWTYDIDLHKRAATSYAGLEGAQFKVTVKDNANKADAKANGSTLKWVLADGTAGDYRQAVAGDQSPTDTVTTGKDGLLRLRGLDLGTYTLTETQAPRNYQPLHSSEDVRISATFMDDKTNWTTPDVQTSATETISQNNSILALKKMFVFNTPQVNATAGLHISDTQAIWGAPTDINGNVVAGTPSDIAANLKDKSGTYYADDKTSWVPANLALLNQPINVMLAQTGGVIAFGLVGVMGIVMLAAGLIVLTRRRVEA